MKRAFVLVLALLALALLPAAAQAHPLGNFSTNHLSTVRISDDAVDVRYVLDQAEIPTVANRRLNRDDLARRIGAEVAQGVTLSVDGRRVALRPARPARLSFPDGQAGLKTTRFELDLRAPAEASQQSQAGGPHL